MTIKALITDLDNTLYDWVAFVVPALEAMVASLVATTGLGEAEIIAALQLAYAEEETAEYAFVLQSSSLFEKSGLDFEAFSESVIHPARLAFAAQRRLHLRPYPGVKETMVKLAERGVRIFGLTDAPAFPAQARLKKLDLDRHFEGLYALENTLPPVGDGGRFLLDAEIQEKQRRGEYTAAFGKPVELAKEHEKPSPAGIRKILFDAGLEPADALLIGDNPAKDMVAALSAGIPPAQILHAAYGARHAPELIARLHRLTPARLNARHRAAGVPAEIGNVTAAAGGCIAVESYAALLDHL